MPATDRHFLNFEAHAMAGNGSHVNTYFET